MLDGLTTYSYFLCGERGNFSQQDATFLIAKLNQKYKLIANFVSCSLLKLSFVSQKMIQKSICAFQTKDFRTQPFEAGDKIAIASSHPAEFEVTEHSKDQLIS